MRIDYRWTVAALALAVAGCNKPEAVQAPAGGTAAAPAVPAPAGQDWTETVAATPEGGFRMGNPAARVKLIEYGALTCPHCAAFEKEASGPLAEMVRSGNVSWEFRTFLLNGIDVPVSLLARCQGPGPFFKLIEQVYAEQQSWIAKLQTMTPAQQSQIQAVPPEQQPRAVAEAAGLITFFGARGLPESKAIACLTDKAAFTPLEQITKNGVDKDAVTGTPAFVINGQPVKDVASWDMLKPKLDAALAG
ncbi:thioredoxin domain-containing protein [Sphingomonas profundi]|uniref:thioredoxin domain-containing protein n=1 Tax=Alterirhizorhabdus profundi TaxID=2681549 RepID=UPI0012E6FF65|nr:thioredoxin domain-containing protein [Sphingomonas profundi]